MRRPASRRGRVGVLALMAASLLAVVGAVTMASPPVVSSQTTPSPTPNASPSPAASPSPSGGARADQDQFRAYVSMVTIDGAGLMAALADLRSCNQGRNSCRRALGAASDKVDSFQADLDSTPPPPCLANTDAELRSSLGFYERGLALIEEGADAKDRLKVTQGGLLVAVGTWKLGVAVRTARRSSCDTSS